MSYINTNLNSLGSQRLLNLSANSLGASIQRLSSGLRINSARDDAAGLAIAERFTTQIKGTDQAARNTNDAISLAQTAEGALGSISNNLQRIRELAVQAASGTQSASDRSALQAEAAQLVAENDRIVTQTEFNGSKLLDGSFTGQQVQIGAGANQTVTMPGIDDFRSSSGPMGQIVGRYDNWLTVRWAPANGYAIGVFIQTTTGASLYHLPLVAIDAKVVATTFNALATLPGLQATADPNLVAAAATQTTVGGVSGTGTITINNVSISLNYTAGAASQNRAAAVSAVNAKSDQTGVVATDTGTGVSLTAADGRNISTAYAAGSATGSVLSDYGLGAAGTAISTPRYSYHPAAHGDIVTINVWAGNGYTGVPLDVIDVSTGKDYYSGTPMSAISLNTAAGAQTAISSADNALAAVNAARASMGAVQSRFQSAIANLQNSSENMSASRSRIQDADFAQETANLSRAQILQQASTAMVAQANLLPQNVLTLLH